MSWASIPYRKLNGSLKKAGARRVLVTWRNEAGDCFVHGALCSGPSRSQNPDGKLDPAVAFVMRGDGRLGRDYPWSDVPSLTYGFRPEGGDKYIPARDLGFGRIFSGSHNGGNAHFLVDDFRKSKIQFFVPAEDQPDTLYELPGSASMYEHMVTWGWMPRQEWTSNIFENISRKLKHGEMQHLVKVEDVLSKSVLTSCKKMLMDSTLKMESMMPKHRHYGRTELLEMWGLSAHLERVAFMRFDSMVSNFAGHVTALRLEDEWRGGPIFEEEFAELHQIRAGGRGRYTEVLQERMMELGGKSTDDAAWAAEVKKREYLARGNPRELWEAPDLEK